MGSEGWHGRSDGAFYDLVFATRDVGGVLAAASDAAAAAFFGPEERMRLQRTPGLDQAIENAKRALERASQ